MPKKILSSKKDKEWEKEVFKQHSTHKGMRPLFAKLESLQILHRNFRASASIVAINKAEQSKVYTLFLSSLSLSSLSLLIQSPNYYYRETRKSWPKRQRQHQPRRLLLLLPRLPPPLLPVPSLSPCLSLLSLSLFFLSSFSLSLL